MTTHAQKPFRVRRVELNRRSCSPKGRSTIYRLPLAQTVTWTVIIYTRTFRSRRKVNRGPTNPTKTRRPTSYVPVGIYYVKTRPYSTVCLGRTRFSFRFLNNHVYSNDRRLRRARRHFPSPAEVYGLRKTSRTHGRVQFTTYCLATAASPGNGTPLFDAKIKKISRRVYLRAKLEQHIVPDHWLQKPVSFHFDNPQLFRALRRS